MKFLKGIFNYKFKNENMFYDSQASLLACLHQSSRLSTSHCIPLRYKAEAQYIFSVWNMFYYQKQNKNP